VLRQLRGSILVAMAAVSVAVLCGAVARAQAPEVQKNGLAYAKGHTAGRGNAGRALLLYHQGGVMTTGATVKAIFWGDWSSPGDKITGINTLYGGISNSPYLRSNIEYTQTGGAHVSAAVSYQGSVTDSSATPGKDPGTSGVLAEVAKMIGGSAV